MTQEQWRRAWSLIEQLKDLPLAERESALRAREPEEAVREQVRAVLQSEESSEEEPARAGAEESYGPYRPLHLLGEGAMGSVYLAQQDKPLKRKVALKVIRPGVRSREVLARFEIERRALAMMDHPNIARVFDSGDTAWGAPYFAMEYVDGVAITRYCEERRAALREKLELIITACEAIQHAHQKGILHRDIKPSNVLVATDNGRPLVKFIDFGIARAVEDAGLDTLGTNFGSVVGTIAYMSPEQAAEGPAQLDTRSDVYSLGALAYEVLTGSPPLRDIAVRTGYANLPELLRRIREEEVEPLGQRAPERKAELAGELDWIVRKALEKEPARRYASAYGLAEDLRRYLQGEPVEAAPPSTIYRWKKFARRYRPWLVTAAAFVLLLAVATGVSVTLAVRAADAEKRAIVSLEEARQAERTARAEQQRALAEQARAVAAEHERENERDKAVTERERADREASKSRAVVDFLQNDLLKVANTAVQADRGVVTPTRDLKVREALDRAAASIGNRFQQQPEVEAEIRNTIGETYFNLNILPTAKEQLQRAYELRKKELGERHPATLESLYGIGKVLRAEGKSAEAAAVAQQVAAGRKQALGRAHRQTLEALHSVAVALRSAGQVKEACLLHEQVLAERKRVLGGEDADTLRSLNDLGIAYIYSSQAAKGLPLAEQAYQLRAKVLGPEHPDTVVSMQAYGMGLFSTGQAERSLPLLKQARELNERLRGKDHSVTLDNTGTIGNAYGALGQNLEAVKYYTLAADGYVRQAGDQHPTGINWRMNAAAAHQGAGRFAEAVKMLQTYLPRWIELRGNEDDRVLQAKYLLAKNLLGVGKADEALEIAAPLLALRIKKTGAASGAVSNLAEVLAQAYARSGRLAEAEGVYRQIYEARKTAQVDATSMGAGLGAVLLEQGRTQEAETLARTLLQGQENETGWRWSYLRGIQGAALTAREDYAGAEALLLPAHQAMIGLKHKAGAPNWYQLGQVREWIAALYTRQGKTEEARRWTTEEVSSPAGSASPR